ncbi:MAG: molecular chaperone DnaK [Vicingaceae bacterium]
MFQTEKQLAEIGDKLPADKKQPIEDALAKLKEAHTAQDLDACNAAVEELNTVFQAASQEMYNAQAQDPQAGQPGGEADAGAKQNDEVTDVDFEEVK